MLVRTLTASAISVMIVSPAAAVQSIGYVGTLGGSVSSAESYNSAGGTNSVTIDFQNKFFRVSLPGLGNGKHANVQVNAANTNGTAHYCTSNGWLSSNGTDVTADVNCFDTQGNPLLADFSLLYQARTVAPPTGAIAFLYAEQAGITIGSSYKPLKAYNFNSTGVLNKVTHTATGTYVAFIPGIGPHGNPQVTAFGLDPARCEIVSWAANGAGTGTNVTVYCVDASNAAKDVIFNLSYTLDANEAVGPNATALGGYAWANNPTRRHYTPATKTQFNSLSPPNLLTAQRFGVEEGQYSLTIPNPNNKSFNTYLGMVTANGTNGEYCDTAGLNVLSGEMYQNVFCYDSSGLKANSRYTGQLIFSH